METTLYNISQVLGIAIIHSLWQGLVIYFVLRIVFTGAPSITPVKKYNVAILAMTSMSAWFIYTLAMEVHNYNWVSLRPLHLSALAPHISLPVGITTRQAWYNTIAGYLPYISILYITGLMVNLTRLGWEWNKIRLIKQSLIPAQQMQQFINSFSKKLHIKKYIQLKFSDLVDVPCVIGYFKPLILLPVSLATYLSACEIEAILLHELSHIKRNDYLVNLLQQVITVILFFNPFAQLINRIISQERENGCDDLVIEKTGRPLIYAQALLKLEETRGVNLQLALSATGKKYHLLNRIERIMKTKKPGGNIRHLLITTLLLAGSLGSIAWFSPKIAEGKTTGKVAKSTLTGSLHLTSRQANVAEQASQTLRGNGSQSTGMMDSNKYIRVSDTTKHKHKSKITVIGKDGIKKQYDSFDELPPETRKQTEEMQKQFNSPEWKKQMEDMKLQGEEMKKQFNGPEWKEQMEDMQKQFNSPEWKKQMEDMQKQFNSSEWKKQMKDMKLQGEEMKKQFNGPEWKKQMEDMQKQFNSPEWKKQMLAMQQQGEEWKKRFNSPEWKKQMLAMQEQGKLMKKQFDNPEWKKQMEDMQKQFNGPEWKKQMEDMQKQFNNPEWKKQMEDMQKQFNSPEWKKQMEGWQKMDEDMKKQFDNPEWKKQLEDMQKQGGEWRKNMPNMVWRLKDSTGNTYELVPQKPKSVKAKKKVTHPTN